MNIKNNFFATGIGSLPFLDKRIAVEFILSTLNQHIPYWPQLPKISFYENMHIQYSQGFPGVTIDLPNKNMYIDTQKVSFIEEFEACFDAINNEKLDYFSISKDYAAGLHEFLRQIPGKDLKFIKGQVIGPISYGMTLLDERKKPILFNAELSQIIASFLACKAKWQIKELRRVSKADIVFFIDEPYLVAIGTSQFASFKKNDIVDKINHVVDAIHKEKALAGIHCCGNTDWSICFDTDIDILSFDAFEFFDSLLIYKDSLNKFIKNGGILSLGIVPNKEDYNLDGYIDKAKEVFKKNKALLSGGAFITPSCGCGTLSIEFAKRAHILIKEIAQGYSGLR